MPFPQYSHTTLTSFDGDEDPIREGSRWIDMPTWPGTTARKASGQYCQNDTGFDDYFTAIQNDTVYSDFEVVLDVATLTMSSNAIDCQFRLQGTTPSYTTRNGYVFYTTTDGNSALTRYDNNVETTLDVDTSGTGTWTSGDKIGVQAIGSALSVWRFRSSTWTEIVSAVDANYSSGKFAPGGFGQAIRLDNMTVGTAGGGGGGNTPAIYMSMLGVG